MLVGFALAACSTSEESLVQPINGERAAFPTWVHVEPGVARGSDLKDLWFNASGKEGWAVGSAALILHYEDAGWHSDTVTGGPASVVWTSIALSGDAAAGFAVGSQGWIARYLGEHRWTATQEARASDSLTSVWVDPSGREGFAAGSGATFLRWRGTEWNRVALPHVSPRIIVRDVVANDEEVWVRHQAKVSVFTRRDLAWLRDIPRFVPEALWVQPPSHRIWTGGVSYEVLSSDPKGHRFTIRWYEPGRSDSVKNLQNLPHAGWIETEPLCGVVLERGAGTGEEPLHRSEYVTSKGVFFWPNPDSADIHALWINHDCSDGWSVGTSGFVGQLSLQHFRISTMREEVAPLEHFDGRYVLVLDSGGPRPRFDSMLLLDDQDTVQLLPGAHILVDTTAHQREIRLEITPTGKRKAMRLNGREVKLRLNMSYAASTPPYPIVYERAGTFRLGEQNRWERIPTPVKWVIPVVVVVLFALLVATRLPRVRRFFFSGHGGDVLEGTLASRLPKFMAAFLMELPERRAGFFADYRRDLRVYLHETGPHSLPQFDVVSCAKINPPMPAALSDDQWKHVLEAALTRGTGLLWVETAPGLNAENLTRGWAEVALQREKTPVLIKPVPERPIENQIRDEWDSYGDIPTEGLPDLWKAGGFVFLFDGSALEDNAAVRLFIRKHQRRNLMILCCPTPPPERGVCHLRASPRAE